MTDTETATLIGNLDIEYQAAVERNDHEAMGQILADDFVLLTGLGRVVSREDLIAEARAGTTTYEYQYAEQRTVRTWGDTAVVTALLRAKGSEAGRKFEYRLWYSDTYVNLGGRWRYVLGQASTRLPDTVNGRLEKSLLLDLRIYRIKPGKAVEFDSLVREETVPLARSFGHRIVAFGPSLANNEVYILVRAFLDADDRRSSLDLLYGSREWKERYDDRVGEMLVSYETAVLAATDEMNDSRIDSGPGTVRSN